MPTHPTRPTGTQLTPTAAIIRSAILAGNVNAAPVQAAYEIERRRPYRPRTHRLPPSQRTAGPGHAS
jgi:hypothetical protein